MLRILIILMITTTAFAEANISDEMAEKLFRMQDNSTNPYTESIGSIIKEAGKNSRMIEDGRNIARSILNEETFSRIEKEQEKVLEQFDIAKPSREADTCADPERLGDMRLFIFVSSSMPEEALNNYVEAVKKLERGIMVMRGLVGDSSKMKPTINFLSKLNCGKTVDELQANGKTCTVSRVDINPQLFRLFNVKRVPTIVYSELPYYELMAKLNLGESLGESDYYMMTGAVSVQYALEKFINAGAGDGAKYLLLKLKNGYYE